MRDKKVYEIMKIEYGRRLNKDGHSLALKQSQIRSYFSRRAAALKRVAVDKVLNSDGGDDDAQGEDELPLNTEATDYSAFKVAELKTMLRAHKLEVSGRKADLIQRLKDAENGHS